MSSAPLRARVSSLAISAGTGPSFAEGTTGLPPANVTLATAVPEAVAHFSCWAGGAAW